MKIRTLLIALFACLFALPALANGPMPESMGPAESHHHSNQGPGRAQWTKKRMKELQDERKRLKHSGPGMMTKARSKVQQFNNPLAYTDADAERAARKRAQLKNAIEFLALKKERGELSPQGQAQLNALINYYRTNYMSGY